jgi:hypothetical protein
MILDIDRFLYNERNINTLVFQKNFYMLALDNI